MPSQWKQKHLKLDFNVRMQARIVRFLEHGADESSLPITHTQAILLGLIIETVEGQIRSTCLIQLGFGAKSYVAQLTSELERHKWCVKKLDPRDRRRKIIKITKAGKRVLEQYKRIMFTDAKTTADYLEQNLQPLHLEFATMMLNQYSGHLRQIIHQKLPE